MTFSFLHMADVHLGSPFRGLSVREPSIAARFAQATRDAFSNLVTLAIDRKVAFVLIAGDLYDREWKDSQLGLFFNREAARLERAEIPIFVLRGNHDAESVVTRSVSLPAGVHTFGATKPTTVKLPDLRVAVHGQSFKDASVPQNLACGYPAAVPGWFNIGLLHTSLTGSAAHDDYAPCSLEDLRERGYDYWALGHIHKREVVSERPHVVYPGNVQGRSVRETGARGATLVHVVDGMVDRLEELHADAARWEVFTCDAAAFDGLDAIAQHVARDVERALAGAEGRLLAFRVRLEGRTVLHDELVTSREILRDEIEAATQRVCEDAWLEKIVIATRPAVASPPLEGPGEPVAAVGFDLAASLTQASSDDLLRERLGSDLADLVRKLPAAEREQFGDALLDEVLDEARAVALAAAGGVE